MSGSLPFCNPLLPSSLPCQAPATNLQLTDILYGTQGQGPQRANQTVQVSLAQVLNLPGSTQYVPFQGSTAAVNLGGALTVGGAVSGAGFVPLFAAPPPIGSTTANSGIFTNLTATGTVTLPVPTFPSQSQNSVFAAPSGAAGVPSFRSVVSSDIATALLTPGPIGSTTANAGTFTTLSATGTSTFGNGSANYLTIAGAASGSGPTITATGSDANITLSLVSKGSGTVLGNVLQAGTTFYPVAAGTVLSAGQLFEYSGTVNPVTKYFMDLTGTASSSQSFFNQYSITDGVAASGDIYGLYVGHILSSSSVKGGRSAFVAELVVSAVPSDTSQNYVGSESTFQTNVAVNATGFGRAVAAVLQTGATGWGELIGDEIDSSIQTGAGALYRHNLQIVLTSDDVVGASVQNAAIVINSQETWAGHGFDVGLAFGSRLGWWAFPTTATLIGTQPAATGSASYVAATGIDFSAVSFSTAFLKSNGFLVDGAGNTTTKAITASGQITSQISANSNNNLLIYNTASGTAAEASFTLATGTSNSNLSWELQDNNGTPYFQVVSQLGSLASYFYMASYSFRTVAGVSLLDVNPTGIVAHFPLQLPVYTSATLPAAGTLGRRAAVSDATSSTFGATYVGGGSNKMPVFDNGTAWVIA